MSEARALQKNALTLEQQRRLSASLDQMLVNCKYDNKPCTFGNGTDTDFKSVFTRMGNCFIFNPNGATQATIPGLFNGLQLTLYVGGMNEKLKRLNSNRGLKIRIHNASKLAELDNGIDVSAGFETNIAVNRQYQRLKAKPYSACELDNDDDARNDKNDNSELFKIMLKSKYEYEQQVCIDLCFQRLANKQCHCSDIETVLLIGKFFGFIVIPDFWLNFGVFSWKI